MRLRSDFLQLGARSTDRDCVRGSLRLSSRGFSTSDLCLFSQGVNCEPLLFSDEARGVCIHEHGQSETGSKCRSRAHAAVLAGNYSPIRNYTPTILINAGLTNFGAAFVDRSLLSLTCAETIDEYRRAAGPSSPLVMQAHVISIEHPIYLCARVFPFCILIPLASDVV
jgi:hypothetical protein